MGNAIRFIAVERECTFANGEKRDGNEAKIGWTWTALQSLSFFKAFYEMP